MADIVCPRCARHLTRADLVGLVDDENKVPEALARRACRFAGAPDVRRDGGFACRVCDQLRGVAVAS